ncbi:cytochrome b/b6 domain-containing protein [Marinomonas sp. C2222]|uniref:Cytochrome b/b6 domain-containing protein n=1 Tax=Marinomonas sargassi TaxID=2984494 RepID=A0ABT2YUV2_9GAMM|nr:cytochrome b/b6 domain-containing protein [Marinomonas sargassi]MCV2403638.1 cytochrome b/b6 domain-containing protein [Marinomonas sargassi]
MKSTLVWDWPIRLCHWLIVLLFSGLIYTGKADEDYMQYHFYMGYMLSAVIIVRVLYGFYGSRYALFSQFVKQPRHAFNYVKSILAGKPQEYLGHNPLGGLMTVFLLLVLTLQWITGLFNSDDIFWYGPFSALLPVSWLSQMSYIHYALPDWLIGAAIIHILAVLYHEFYLKELLTAAMIHGHKKYTKAARSEVKTPRWGVVFSLLIGAAWFLALYLMPI